MKKLICLIFVFAAGILNASELKFMASETLGYDDNIYLTNGNKVGSAISSTKIGALYNLAIPYSSLEGKFSIVGGYNAFQKHNNKNGFWDTLAVADFGNENFKIGNIFLLTSDPANSELTERKQRINNNIYASYRTGIYDKLNFGFKISDEINKYTSGGVIKYLDRNRFNIGTGVYYNISEKTNLLAEYTFTALTYQNNHDSNSTGGIFALGIEGKLSPKIEGEAKLTYNYRNYKHDIAGYKNNADLLGYDLSVTWKPTTQNVLRLSGTRNFEETIYDNNRYFVSTGVKLYGSQKILEKFTAALTLAYENLSYNTANSAGIKRSDDVYTVRPEVNYQFKDWLSAGVWYQYRKRASNAGSDIHYLNNRAGASIKAVF